MGELEDVKELVQDEMTGLARYMRDNPLVMVAGAMISGVLLARFGFLGTPKEAAQRA